MRAFSVNIIRNVAEPMLAPKLGGQVAENLGHYIRVEGREQSQIHEGSIDARTKRERNKIYRSCASSREIVEQEPGTKVSRKARTSDRRKIEYPNFGNRSGLNAQSTSRSGRIWRFASPRAVFLSYAGVQVEYHHVSTSKQRNSNKRFIGITRKNNRIQLLSLNLRDGFGIDRKGYIRRAYLLFEKR